MSDTTLTIGELAKATQTKAVTIRYYEQLGLLPPSKRTAAGYRIYDDVERDRLLFVRRSRGLGFSLDDIRELLGFADHREASCASVDAKVAQQLDQVRGRIRDLQALETELQRLLGCCQGGMIDECRIIESLTRHDQP
ncbi:helix-turn-helix domain-containing protein [Pseudomonas sp. zfem002]|uniref:MerR family transcriptional regulator n=1 Tax=Pseudomonas sp. zfem002 TaxID=3078197 RepID=UPI002928AFEC|nr:helix-turn-helix domain-containing protein [Pseudomonas sp. zfem002]MDU9390523.1 helix-turn-helix domain-containing protein [Pseudomonas sp. zfem002]